MKMKIVKSGNKHTVKVIPETTKEVEHLTALLGKPCPEKGTHNPVHWHVRAKDNDKEDM